MKCRLAEGVTVYKTSEEEVILSSSSRTVILKGPAAVLLDFLNAFASVDVAEDVEVTVAKIASTCRENLEEMIAGLKEVTSKLLAAGIFIPEFKESGRDHFARIACLAPVRTSGIDSLMQSLPAAIRELWLVGQASKVEHAELPGGYTVHRMQTWDEVSRLTESDSPTLLIALGLSDAELHHVNRHAVITKTPWMYVAYSGQRIVVSPICQTPVTPCFACARMRRLGAVSDIVSNAAFEANLITKKPDLQVRAAIVGVIERIATALLLGKIEKPTAPFHLHLLNKEKMTITDVPLVRLPDCPVCGTH